VGYGGHNSGQRHLGVEGSIVSIFTDSAPGKCPVMRGVNLENIILNVLSQSEWTPTTKLYRASGNMAKRDDMHQILKLMLKDKKIVMQVIHGKNRSRTQFLLYPLKQPSATQPTQPA
jgi:hypothetical protein